MAIAMNLKLTFTVIRLIKQRVMQNGFAIRILNYSLKAEESGISHGLKSKYPLKLEQDVKGDLAYYTNKLRDISIFSNAKSVLHNVFNNIKTNLDPSYRLDAQTKVIGRINHRHVFCCSCTLNWPQKMTVTGYSFNKKRAENIAFIKAVETLHKERHITNNGQPVTMSTGDLAALKEEWNKPFQLTFPETFLTDGHALIRKYYNDIEPLIQHFQECYLNENTDPDLEERNKLIHPLTGQRYWEDNGSKEKLNDGMPYFSTDEISVSNEMPIFAFKEKILSSVEKNQVTVISGETGCGKSTQVPQFIYNYYTSEVKARPCSILVSQPRRISAVSLAKRVAEERNEFIGKTVGYHVRLDYKRVRSQNGVMFCTTGMLLQICQNNPELKGISHIIIDEVHERSVQNDLLLLFARRILMKNPSLKVILMSASFSPGQFLEYFNADKSSLITIPGKVYPLQRHYLEDSFKILKLNAKKYDLSSLGDFNQYPRILPDLFIDVITSVHSSYASGAIMCFLPGWQEIKYVQNKINKHRLSSELCVIPLHSKITINDQQKVFEKLHGKRKVVLATNIAETSITVPDVVFVIDCGLHRENRFDSKRNITALQCHWISKANAQQRAGRAGRVAPGTVFHLYPEKVYQSMDSYPMPEIKRIGLEEVVLQSKAYCGNESVTAFLEDAIDVPQSQMITLAVKNLVNLGMFTFDENCPHEMLTPLGLKALHFSTPPAFSKALIYSSFFGCLEPVLTSIAYQTGSRSIFMNSVENKDSSRSLKQQASLTSDLEAAVSLIRNVESFNDYHQSLEFCNERNLSLRSINFISALKGLLREHVIQSNLADSEDVFCFDSPCNKHSWNTQLFLAMFLTSGAHLLKLQKGIYTRGILRKNVVVLKSEKQGKVETNRESIFHKKLNLQSDYLYCVAIELARCSESRRNIARDLSILSPHAVAIFGGRFLYVQKLEADKIIVKVDGSNLFSFETDKKSSMLVNEIRKIMQNCLNYFLQASTYVPESLYTVEEFWESFNEYLSHIIKINRDSGEKFIFQDRSSLYTGNEKNVEVTGKLLTFNKKGHAR